VGPHHHDVAHPWVADGGDSHTMWMVSASILNKQSQTAYKGWFSNLAIE